MNSGCGIAPQQRGERAQQIAFQRAADAAVAQADHAIAGISDQLRIDVDCAEIVDHGGDAPSLGVRQQVVHDRGLACAEEAGDEQDRNRHNQLSMTGRRTGRPGRAATSSTPSLISG
jgi:hypothetical protein